MKKINHVFDDTDIHPGIYRKAIDWIAANPGKQPSGGTNYPLPDIADYAQSRAAEIEADMRRKFGHAANPFGF